MGSSGPSDMAKRNFAPVPKWMYGNGSLANIQREKQSPNMKGDARERTKRCIARRDPASNATPIRLAFMSGQTATL